MLDDFLVRALLAGLGVALVAGPLGCFVVWRRMAYFGDTLAHASLLGVAISYLLSVAPLFAMLASSGLIAWSLLSVQRRASLGSDTVLGILSHGALAVGLVSLSFAPEARVDLFAYLFGDILAVNALQLSAIWGGGAVILLLLIWQWRSLFAATVNPELAAAEGIDVKSLERRFVLLLAGAIVLAVQVVGILMVTALLIIPAAGARRFAASPERMAVIAAVVGSLSVLAGLWGSFVVDSPSGPSIVVAALALFLLGLLKRAKE